MCHPDGFNETICSLPPLAINYCSHVCNVLVTNPRDASGAGQRIKQFMWINLHEWIVHTPHTSVASDLLTYRDICHTWRQTDRWTLSLLEVIIGRGLITLCAVLCKWLRVSGSLKWLTVIKVSSLWAVVVCWTVLRPREMMSSELVQAPSLLFASGSRPWRLRHNVVDNDVSWW